MLNSVLSVSVVLLLEDDLDAHLFVFYTKVQLYLNYSYHKMESCFLRFFRVAFSLTAVVGLF